MSEVSESEEPESVSGQESNSDSDQFVAPKGCGRGCSRGHGRGRGRRGRGSRGCTRGRRRGRERGRGMETTQGSGGSDTDLDHE